MARAPRSDHAERRATSHPAECPVIIAFTVPAARYLGYGLTAELTALLARRYGVRYALHLDHCESADEIRQAVEAGFLGFDCGSLHGMRERRQGIALDLVRSVAQATGLPIVLHGSSGVRDEDLQAGIDAGIRKVNTETAIRAAYLTTVRETVSGPGDGARKPRYLTKATDQALYDLYCSLLASCTLRRR